MSQRLAGTCTIALGDLVKRRGSCESPVSTHPAVVRLLTVNSDATYDDELINHPPQFIVTTYE